MTSPRPRLELVVDEVVLYGVPPEQAQSVAAALETGLTALAEGWTRGGGPLSDRHESRQRVTDAVEAPASSPAALGAALAGAVWQDVTGGGRR